MSGPRGGGRRDVTRAGMASAGFVPAEGEDSRPTMPRRVEKPWGYELIWASTEHYAGKILVVNAGEALSLQFHEEKDETLHLLEGELQLEIGPGLDALEPCVLAVGQSVRIRPGMLHRIRAVTDCQVLEASTPELDDVVRVQDRYGRAPTDEPET